MGAARLGERADAGLERGAPAALEADEPEPVEEPEGAGPRLGGSRAVGDRDGLDGVRVARGRSSVMPPSQRSIPS